MTDRYDVAIASALQQRHIKDSVATGQHALLVERFISENGGTSELDSLSDTQLSDCVNHWLNTSWLFGAMQGVTVTFERDYLLADGSRLKLGITAKVETGGIDGIHHAYHVLKGVVASQLDHLKTQGLKLASAGAAGSGSAAGNGGGDGVGVSFESLKLRVAHNGKSKTFKVLGGVYTKFGVSVFPEVLEAAGIDAESLPMGESDFKRVVHAIKDKEGKVDKIIKID